MYKKSKYIKINDEYRERLQNGKQRHIREMSIPQQAKYDRWSDKIIEIKMKCGRKCSKGKECKKIAERSIRRYEKNLGIQTEESENSLQRQRLLMLTIHIEEEKLEQHTRKLVKTVEYFQKAPGIISVVFFPCSTGPKCLRESSLQVRRMVYMCFTSSLPLVSFRGLD